MGGSTFFRFNAVGVVGFVVQLGMLALLLRLGTHYLVATALAVEAAILHNFLWHERWTWPERATTGRARLAQLGRFHLLNGLVSLVGNLLLMRLLVGALHLPEIPSNLIAVILCSIVNFVASDRAVFQHLSPRIHDSPNPDSGFRTQDSGFGIQDSGFGIQD